jgi:4-amino-4-deoxy-L-arabinose transferase-like glycosyltransferase
MKGKWFLIFFLFVFLVGSFLRIYQLGNIPGSMDWDEVSFGYNAYSVLYTGKDEYGVSYPLTFRAFGEYKQPVYAYLDVLSIGLFGLNAFAVRFPSALFGSISIIFVYLLTYELFRKYKFAKNLALLSMALFAISPWSIHFSRIAFEANVAVSLVIVAAWLFLKGLSVKNNWYLYGSTLLFCLSELTYISVRLIGPLLFITLLFYSFTLLKKQKITLFALILLFIVGSSIGYINSKSLSRGQDVLFTNQQTAILQTSIKKLQYAKEQHDVLGEIIYNRRIVYTEKYFANYFSHFNPHWLFVTGDSIKRHHAPGIGNLYFVSFPFIILGIYFLLKRTFATSWIIFVWCLLAPLASSLTSDAPSALRSLLFLPTWQIFEAAGIIFLLEKVKSKNLLFFLQVIILSLYTVNFCYYIQQYFSYTNTDTNVEKAWQYGYKDAVLFANRFKNTDKRIVFSKDFEQPYIFYLFYTHYDPSAYLVSGGSSRIAKSCYSINNVYFGDCRNRLRTGDIYIALGEDSSEKGKVIKQILYADHEPAITAYQK